MAARFEIRRKRGGQFHFVLIAGNGQVVATSENYTTKARCQNGIASVKRIAGDAPVIDLAEDARRSQAKASSNGASARSSRGSSSRTTGTSRSTTSRTRTGTPSRSRQSSSK